MHLNKTRYMYNTITGGSHRRLGLPGP